jgi:hypothetical protein
VPDDDAYGRVTNPQRYLPLHDFARTLIDHVVGRFAATATNGGLDEFDDRMRQHIDAVVRIAPTVGHGGPIIIAFTSFPAIVIRLGSHFSAPFPSCGCDACDEPVDVLCHEMTDMIDTYVAGGLTEWLVGNRLGFDLQNESNRSGWTRLDRDRRAVIGRPFRRQWPAWPLRRSETSPSASNLAPRS